MFFMKVVLISCASKKLNVKSKAKELYVSPLFKLNLKYAESLNPDKIFILSAKHGLLRLDEEVKPYDETLNKIRDFEIKIWADKVLNKLSLLSDLKKDEFIFLAGEKYRKHLLPGVRNFKIPLEGLGIGKQLKFLKEHTKNFCPSVHKLFNSLERHKFPFDKEKIPLNGVYILFQKGELAHSGDRIVRVGTHTGQNQLLSRLDQHFVNENKDRSIFRKNIGRALLNREKDPYLKVWELDLTTKESRGKFGDLVDKEKQDKIEKQVSEFIQDNFSFAVIKVDGKNERLSMESKVIFTLSLCKECTPSIGWLGLFSPKEKIRDSGLWLVNELYKEPLSEKDFAELINSVFQSAPSS